MKKKVQVLYRRLRAVAAGSALFGFGTAGGTLLGATETDGLAVDFTAATPDLLIRDAASTLNYSGTPFLNDGGKLTFSRTSLATVVDDDGLIKWAPHNLVFRSQEFDNASWTKTAILAFGSGSTANAIAAPDGTTTADLIVESATSAVHFVDEFAANSSRALATATLSVFAKAKERTAVVLALNTTDVQQYGSAVFDLQNGVVSKTQSGSNGLVVLAASSIADAGGGWYLCTIRVANTTAGNSSFPTIQISNSTTPTIGNFGRVTYSGDGTSGIYLWGAHLYRSDLGGMQDNGTAYPTYNPTVAAAYYGPRIDHDPVTPFAKRGLLMEEARTNLILHSEAFDNAGWTKADATITANAVAAPDGTTTADALVESATTAEHAVFQGISFAGGTTYTSTIYAKANTRNFVMLQLPSVPFSGVTRAWFDLSNGTVGTLVNSPTATITDVGGGWYRCRITKTASGTANANAVFEIANVDGTNNYAGDGVSSIYIWGAQLEAGAFPTSYIPTTTASVTRAVDACSIATSLFPYVLGPGTLIVEAADFAGDNGAGTSTNAHPFVRFVSSAANYVKLGRSNTSSRTLRVDLVTNNNGAGATSIETLDNGYAVDVPVKAAAAFDVNDGSLVVNGAAPITTASLNPPSTVTPTPLDTGVNLRIRQITYIPRRITNAELQTRTTLVEMPNNTLWDADALLWDTDNLIWGATYA